jgi:CMP-N-acetylneuraminic acid synthetase
MTRRLAIIPARGGSKRLPRKNILAFLGRPIIAHTIEAATESGCFTRILVSTEDAEIADAARAAGAEILSATLRSPPMLRSPTSASTFSPARSAIPSPASIRRRRCDAPATLSPLLRSLSALTSTLPWL